MRGPLNRGHLKIPMSDPECALARAKTCASSAKTKTTLQSFPLRLSVSYTIVTFLVFKISSFSFLMFNLFEAFF